MIEQAKNRRLVIVTADSVKANGIISFKFMIELGKKKPELRGTLPNLYGLIRECDKNEYSFNIFEGGKGLVAGGGWTSHDSDDWQKKVLDAIPSCTILMDIDLLEWWKALAKKYGVEFEHYHIEGIVYTS